MLRICACDDYLCTHTYTYTHSLSLSHTHTFAYTHTLTHARTHTHTHTLTTRLSDITPPENALCPSLSHTHTHKACPSPHSPDFLANTCIYFFLDPSKKRNTYKYQGQQHLLVDPSECCVITEMLCICICIDYLCTHTHTNTHTHTHTHTHSHFHSMPLLPPSLLLIEFHTSILVNNAGATHTHTHNKYTHTSSLTLNKFLSSLPPSCG